MGAGVEHEVDVEGEAHVEYEVAHEVEQEEQFEQEEQLGEQEEEQEVEHEVEVEWLGVGVEVRVGVEDLLHCARMGELGVVEGTCADNDDEVLVKFVSKGSTKAVRIPLALLVAEGLKPRKMRMWDHVKDEVLEGMLRSVGTSDPCGERLPEEPWMRLSLWADWLLHAYSGGGLTGLEDDLERAVVLSPSFCEAFSKGSAILEQVEDEVDNYEGTLEKLREELSLQEVRIKHVRDSWEKAEVLITLLSDEREGKCALWVLRKNPRSERLYEAGVTRNDKLRKQLTTLRNTYFQI